MPSRQSTGVAADAVGALRVGLLTGADDRSYALGLATSLIHRGVHLDFIGSDAVDGPELHGTPLVRFLNLRGDQSNTASLARKAWRLLRYYLRLMAYAATAKTRLLHILWNNKFECFDRTVLMAYYRLLGHRIVMTAHNVNAAKRDGRDSYLNRLTLRMQYRLCEHVFVHTPRMRDELHEEFDISRERISVIPFGINNTTPVTEITREEARQSLGLSSSSKVALFFGQIAPYKGLEYLVDALPELTSDIESFRLVIAGKVKSGSGSYWRAIQDRLADPRIRDHVIERIAHIPDSDVERYFKAADVLVIPYTNIFQSGVPFLAYSFGLPVIATDVGALRDDVVEGATGLICAPRDAAAIAQAIRAFFESRMFRDQDDSRASIRAMANERHSWAKVASITCGVYQEVLGVPPGAAARVD